MNDETAERIHTRIDQINTTINNVNLLYTEQKQDIKHLSDGINKFIEKTDKIIFHTEEGFIVKTKTKLSNLCIQVKNQWYLITIIFVGILGIAWNAMSKK